MDKFIEHLRQMPGDFLHKAKSYASESSSPKIEPVHILRALLHKETGLADFIENSIDSDYYYLLDWADVKMNQVRKSPYPMKEEVLSDEARSVVKEAVRISRDEGNDNLDPRALLASIASPGVGFTADELKTFPVSSQTVIDAISGTTGKRQEGEDNHIEKRSSPINSFGGNEYFINLLKEDDGMEVIGFENQLKNMVETLSRKDRANLLVIGEPGIGKTSLIAGLVQKIKKGDVPTSLKKLYPVELDLITLSQGVTYKGEVEDRFRKVCDELGHHPQPIMIIENFHRVLDRQGLLIGILPLLKRLLAKNSLQVILSSSIDGYTKDIEKDKELTSYFEKIAIEEPDEATAIAILKSKVPAYSEFHSIELEEDVPKEIVRLAKRYVPERNLPSSAIDLLDRAMASIKIASELKEPNTTGKLDKEYVRDVTASMTGLPIGNIQSEEREKLENAEEILHRRVVGQNHAVKSILDAIYESRSGLNKKGQPIGSFFFLGPTGTGKTELAKALAEFLFNDETCMLRFDMSEYKEEHSVALLYGAPPGYVGYEEGGLLVNQIRQHPYSVVLFDEIEKAHRSVFDLFLQILDEGKLHDRLGRVGDFSNALVIFTSNIGSDYIFKSFEASHVPTHDEMLEVMQGHFRPEFLARITEILPFSPITAKMIDKIFDIHIGNLVRSLDQQDIKLEIDETAREYITRVGFNSHYGARPVLGIIRKEIRRPLSKMIIAGDVEPGDTVVMKHSSAKDEMVWEIE